MLINHVLNMAAESVRLTARRRCWPQSVRLIINRGHTDTYLIIFTDVTEELDSVRVPWAATTEDLCADDWEVA